MSGSLRQREEDHGCRKGTAQYSGDTGPSIFEMGRRAGAIVGAIPNSFDQFEMFGNMFRTSETFFLKTLLYHKVFQKNQVILKYVENV